MNENNFDIINQHLQEAANSTDYPYGIQPDAVGPALLWKIDSAMKGQNDYCPGLSVEEACRLILGPAKCRYPTPATVREAFSLADKTLVKEKSKRNDINMSSIATILIQNVGRFTERFASDFIIDWDSVRDLIKDAAPGDNSIVVFGIRRNGVDHTTFLMNKLQEQAHMPYLNVEAEYRKIFAVRVTMDEDGYLTAELKDLTDSFLRFHQSDTDWKPSEHCL